MRLHVRLAYGGVTALLSKISERSQRFVVYTGVGFFLIFERKFSPRSFHGTSMLVNFLKGMSADEFVTVLVLIQRFLFGSRQPCEFETSFHYIRRPISFFKFFCLQNHQKFLGYTN